MKHALAMAVSVLVGSTAVAPAASAADAGPLVLTLLGVTVGFRRASGSRRGAR